MGAALFVFRDIVGHDTGGHLGWDDWEEVGLGFWTTWRECNQHVMFVEAFGGCFLIFIGFRGIVDENLAIIYLPSYPGSSLPYSNAGILPVGCQAPETSFMFEWLLKLHFWVNCSFKEWVINLFDATDPQNMMISFLKYKGSYIFSCRNTNLYCEK